MRNTTIQLHATIIGFTWDGVLCKSPIICSIDNFSIRQRGFKEVLDDVLHRYGSDFRDPLFDSGGYFHVMRVNHITSKMRLIHERFVLINRFVRV